MGESGKILSGGTDRDNQVVSIRKVTVKWMRGVMKRKRRETARNDCVLLHVVVSVRIVGI